LRTIFAGIGLILNVRLRNLSGVRCLMRVDYSPR